ncbi:hypothetical protein ACHAWU_004440 [Discostella pseudostelligera]|uniref:tRNA-binding domain-containing protein n=1 Tax=Discostella pseudostelligera TaxID=259834 RepID=A0ABD3M1Y6_9STRA
MKLSLKKSEGNASSSANTKKAAGGVTVKQIQAQNQKPNSPASTVSSSGSGSSSRFSFSNPFSKSSSTKATTAATGPPPPITSLDIRVGRVTKVWAHEKDAKLYCFEIDIGTKDGPRQIASSLRSHMYEKDLNERMVLVVCNTKKQKLSGFASHGMILCATNRDKSVIKLVDVPIDAKIGERVVVPGHASGEPVAEKKVEKVVEKIAPYLRTSQYGVPVYCGKPLSTSAGVCTSPVKDGFVLEN